MNPKSIDKRKAKIEGWLIVFLIHLFASCISTLGYVLLFPGSPHTVLIIVSGLVYGVCLVLFFIRSSSLLYVYIGAGFLNFICCSLVMPQSSVFAALAPLCIWSIYLFVSKRVKVFFGIDPLAMESVATVSDTEPTVPPEKYSFPSIYGTPKSTETDVSDASPSDMPAQTDATQEETVLPETEAAPSESEAEPSSASPVFVSSADAPPKKKPINKTAVVITAIVCVTAIALVCLFMFGGRPASPVSAPIPSPSDAFPSVVGTWELDKVVYDNIGDNGLTLSKEKFFEYAGYSEFSEYSFEFESDGSVIWHVETYQVPGTWQEVGMSYIAKFPLDDSFPYRFVLDDNVLTLDFETDDFTGTLYFEKQ